METFYFQIKNILNQIAVHFKVYLAQRKMNIFLELKSHLFSKYALKKKSQKFYICMKK